MKIIINESQLKLLLNEKSFNNINEDSNTKNKLIFDVKSKLKNINIIDVPFYVYCALRFMRFETSTLTEKETPQYVLNELSNILCEKSVRMKTCNPNQWSGTDEKNNSNKNYLGYSDMTSQYSKSSTYKKSGVSFNQPENLKSVILVLGQANVIQSGKNWIVTDVYNFDNIQQKYPYLKTNNIFRIAWNNIQSLLLLGYDMATGRGAARGTERILSQYHNLGYKGFNVRIVVPMGNCRCTS